mgnify:CR=1 FL=1
MSDVIRRDDLVMGPREKAIAAVEAGDKEEALKQIEALHMLFKPLHDRYCEWINYLFTYIAENLGEEHVGIAMQGTFDAVYGKLFAAGGKMPKRTPEQMISGMAQGHLVHHSDIYVEEDDEKYVLYVKHCGSGSTVQKNYTDKGRTSKGYPWSADTKGMCYYCCHEPCWMGGDNKAIEYHRFVSETYGEDAAEQNGDGITGKENGCQTYKEESCSYQCGKEQLFLQGQRRCPELVHHDSLSKMI